MISDEPITVDNIAECRIGDYRVVLGHPNPDECPDIDQDHLVVLVTHKGVLEYLLTTSTPRTAYRRYRWHTRRLMRQVLGALT